MLGLWGAWAGPLGLWDFALVPLVFWRWPSVWIHSDFSFHFRYKLRRVLFHLQSWILDPPTSLQLWHLAYILVHIIFQNWVGTQTGLNIFTFYNCPLLWYSGGFFSKWEGTSQNYNAFKKIITYFTFNIYGFNFVRAIYFHYCTLKFSVMLIKANLSAYWMYVRCIKAPHLHELLCSWNLFEFYMWWAQWNILFKLDLSLSCVFLMPEMQADQE